MYIADNTRINVRKEVTKNMLKFFDIGTSLVVQWLRIHLPMQGTQVRSLAQEFFTCHRATKPMCHK